MNKTYKGVVDALDIPNIPVLKRENGKVFLNEKLDLTLLQRDTPHSI